MGGVRPCRRVFRVGRGDAGAGAEIGRHVALFSPRQPGQRIDPRGGDDSAVAPFSAVFNNLIRFNQHEKQNRPEFIEPELAESWKWNDDYTRLTFKLRDGVKWHDGKPFGAADVKCTWDMILGTSQDKLPLSTRARHGTATSTRL